MQQWHASGDALLFARVFGRVRTLFLLPFFISFARLWTRAYSSLPSSPLRAHLWTRAFLAVSNSLGYLKHYLQHIV